MRYDDREGQLKQVKSCVSVSVGGRSFETVSGPVDWLGGSYIWQSHVVRRTLIFDGNRAGGIKQG